MKKGNAISNPVTINGYKINGYIIKRNWKFNIQIIPISVPESFPNGDHFNATVDLNFLYDILTNLII